MKRLASIKQQLESYKRQTLELQNKLADETKRADKWEFECTRVQEKFAIQQREKEVEIFRFCHKIFNKVSLNYEQKIL